MLDINAMCRRFEAHWAALAFSFAPLSAGNSKAARMAMIATTTNSSMSVNPEFRCKNEVRSVASDLVASAEGITELHYPISNFVVGTLSKTDPRTRAAPERSVRGQHRGRKVNHYPAF